MVTKLLDLEPALLSGETPEEISEELGILFGLEPSQEAGDMFGRATVGDLLSAKDVSVGVRENMLEEAKKFFRRVAVGAMAAIMRERVLEDAAKLSGKNTEGLVELIAAQEGAIASLAEAPVGLGQERKIEQKLSREAARLREMRELSEWAVPIEEAVIFALSYEDELGEAPSSHYQPRDRYYDSIKYGWGSDYGLDYGPVHLEDRASVLEWATMPWVPSYDILYKFPAEFAEAWVATTEAEAAIEGRAQQIESTFFVTQDAKEAFFSAFPSHSPLAR